MSLLNTNKQPEFRPTSSNPVLDHTTIGSTVIITGDVKCNGDIRIDGELKGNLVTNSRLILGQKGKITGDVICANAEIEGTFKGKMDVKELLSAKQTARMEGNLFFSRLSVEQPALFNVTCSMKGTQTEAVQPTMKAE